MQTNDMKPLTLETLAAFVVANINSYDRDTRFTLDWYNTHDDRDTRNWQLQSTSSGTRWSSRCSYLPVSPDLAKVMWPLFGFDADGKRPYIYGERTRTWLTLQGIVKRLGISDIGAQVKAATKAAKDKAEKNARNITRQRLITTTRTWYDAVLDSSRTSGSGDATFIALMQREPRLNEALLRAMLALDEVAVVAKQCMEGK